MGKLTRIQLKGFKSIREIDLELRHLNILMGPNGAGKSNFIDFFRFMNKLVQKDLQFFVALQGGAGRFLHFGRKTTDTIQTRLLFSDSDYVCKLVPDQTGKLIFKEEYGQWPKVKEGQEALRAEEGGIKTLANRGDKESGLQVKLTNSASHVASYLSDWQVYHFHDTSDTAKVKQSASVHDNERLRPQAENLAAFLFSIDETEQYRRIVQTIQSTTCRPTCGKPS